MNTLNAFTLIGFLLMTATSVLLLRQLKSKARRRRAPRPARRGATQFPTVFQPPKRALLPPPVHLSTAEWMALGEAVNARRDTAADPAALDRAMRKVADQLRPAITKH